MHYRFLKNSIDLHKAGSHYKLSEAKQCVSRHGAEHFWGRSPRFIDAMIIYRRRGLIKHCMQYFKKLLAPKFQRQSISECRRYKKRSDFAALNFREQIPAAAAAPTLQQQPSNNRPHLWPREYRDIPRKVTERFCTPARLYQNLVFRFVDFLLG